MDWTNSVHENMFDNVSFFLTTLSKVITPFFLPFLFSAYNIRRSASAHTFYSKWSSNYAFHHFYTEWWRWWWWWIKRWWFSCCFFYDFEHTIWHDTRRWYWFSRIPQSLFWFECSFSSFALENTTLLCCYELHCCNVRYMDSMIIHCIDTYRVSWIVGNWRNFKNNTYFVQIDTYSCVNYLWNRIKHEWSEISGHVLL